MLEKVIANVAQPLSGMAFYSIAFIFFLISENVESIASTLLKFTSALTVSPFASNASP